MKVLESFAVKANANSQRLSDFAIGIFKGLPSRKSVKKAIKAGSIYVNDQVQNTGYWVKPGDVLQYVDLELPPRLVYERKIEVVYEDDSVAVVNKPGGLVVSGNQFMTLENALPHNLYPSTAPDALKGFRCVHRLDAPTCGLLLVAKTRSARMLLGQQFEAGTIKKTYTAICMGHMPPSGGLFDPIDDKKAKTLFTTLDIAPSMRQGMLSKVALFPHTGRTHQLRKHMAAIGCPILGDRQYGPEGHVLRGKGLFLCASELAFTHPEKKEEIVIRLAPPEKFDRFLNKKRNWLKQQNAD